MKVKTKLILGFLIIALLVLSVGYFSLYQIGKIAVPSSKDIPSSISDLNKASHLDSLAQFIRYYDELLTQSARNYAFTQNQKWEQRYRDAEPQLDKIIKESIELGDEKDKGFFKSIDESNLALVKLEYQSIDFVNKGKPEEAVKILESDEYWNQKRIYEQGLRDFVARRGLKYDEALLASTKTLDAATENINRLIKGSTRSIVIFVVFSLILAAGLGIFLSSQISKSLEKFEDASNEISKGNLDVKVDIKSNDEFNDLAETFNNMAQELKNLKRLGTVKKAQKELEAVEASRKLGFISEESYGKAKKRLTEILAKPQNIDVKLLQEKGFIKID